jgi:hypothetical protein
MIRKRKKIHDSPRGTPMGIPVPKCVPIMGYHYKNDGSLKGYQYEKYGTQLWDISTKIMIHFAGHLKDMLWFPFVG